MSSQNLRIFFSIFVAFIVVSFYKNYLSTGSFISFIQAKKYKKIFSNIKLPKLNLSLLFTLKTNQTNQKEVEKQNNINYSFFFPTAPVPRPTSEVAHGLSEKPTPTIFNENFNNQFQIILTNTPKPTKPPKPTATPEPPAITTAQRPGSTLKEIYEEIEKRVCVPAALMYAIQKQETGPWWPINTASSKVKIYNKYGWWLDGSGNSCTGMGYHTQTGIVPNDAVDAGTKCQNPIPSDVDQAIMGLWQISKYEEDAAKKYMTKIIKGNIDRRVIFDNALIFAIITKNRLDNPPKNCSNWSNDDIKTVAQKHYGSCGDNYCANILKYYNEYKKL